MKFKVIDYQNKDIRIIKRFLLIPTKINNEMRWWENVYIKQEYEPLGRKSLG